MFDIQFLLKHNIGMKVQDLLIDKKLEKTAGIYLIYCSASQKGYIGRSKNIKSRWQTHKTRLRKQIHENIHMQRAWSLYGEGVFLFLVLENCLNIAEREEFWISQIEDLSTLYNMKSVEGLIEFNMPEEAKRKISVANKGRALSEEHKQKLKEANIGKKHSEETKQKRADACKEAWVHKTNGFKLTKEKAVELKNKLKDIQLVGGGYGRKNPPEFAKLAEEYGISITSLYDIKKNKTWSNI